MAPAPRSHARSASGAARGSAGSPRAAMHRSLAIVGCAAAGSAATCAGAAAPALAACSQTAATCEAVSASASAPCAPAPAPMRCSQARAAASPAADLGAPPPQQAASRGAAGCSGGAAGASPAWDASGLSARRARPASAGCLHGVVGASAYAASGRCQSAQPPRASRPGLHSTGAPPTLLPLAPAVLTASDGAHSLLGAGRPGLTPGAVIPPPLSADAAPQAVPAGARGDSAPTPSAQPTSLRGAGGQETVRGAAAARDAAASADCRAARNACACRSESPHQLSCCCSQRRDQLWQRLQACMYAC